MKHILLSCLCPRRMQRLLAGTYSGSVGTGGPCKQMGLLGNEDSVGAGKVYRKRWEPPKVLGKEEKRELDLQKSKC